MSMTLQIFACISGIILIYMAVKANMRHKMTERQSLFWIIGGIIVIFFGLFPQLIYLIAYFFSVEYPPSIIFAIAIILAIYGIFNCYKTNAELTARVQELAMQVSLLNEENSHLKEFFKQDKPDCIGEKKNNEEDIYEEETAVY